MGIIFAFAAGYVIGARAGREELDDVVQALQAIRDSDEFRDLVRSLRVHAAHTLREVAAMLDGSSSGPGALRSVSTQDLVDRVKDIVGRE
jgi:hypothetical protein